MRTILSGIVLALCPFLQWQVGQRGFQPLGSPTPTILPLTCAQNSSSVSFGPFNSSGYIIAVVGIAYNGGFGTPTVSDNLSNTYTSLTAYPNATNAPAIQIFWSKLTTTSSSTTITVNGSAVAACPILYGNINGVLNTGSDFGQPSGVSVCEPNPSGYTPTQTSVQYTFEGGSVPTAPVTDQPQVFNSGGDVYTVTAPVYFNPGTAYGGVSAYSVWVPSDIAATAPGFEWTVASVSFCNFASWN